MKSLIFIFLIILSSIIVPQDKSNSSNSLNKITTNDDYDYIAINQIKMLISNNGSGADQYYYSKNIVFWPGGENATLSLIYDDGLIWGGYIGSNLIIGGNKYCRALQAGKILSNGLADDPSLTKYKLYKIKKGWEELPLGQKKERYKKDYEEWPVDDGAPFYDINNDGSYKEDIDKPLFLGDEYIWCVMNDLHPLCGFNCNSSIGLEIQMSVYGYVHPSLADVIFRKYLIINKSQDKVDELYFGLFSDTDVGYNLDDYLGCDTLLNLAYCYNADNDDDLGYGENPPAVGYLLLQGTTVKGSSSDSVRINNKWTNGIKDQKMTSFSTNPYEYSWSQICGHDLDCNSVIESFTYNCLKGELCDGSPHLNPIDSIITKYPFSGNPVDSTGWYMGYHSLITHRDRNMYLNTGPITMAPADTQEVVIAIIAARGSNNLQSINVLKNTAKIVQYFYDNYTPELSNINYSPPIPEYYYLSQNYPNPFNPKTKIVYELPLPGIVTLKVFDLLGQEIRTLINEEKSAGKYEVEFSSDGLSSGIYFYTFNSRAYTKTKKMLVVK